MKQETCTILIGSPQAAYSETCHANAVGKHAKSTGSWCTVLWPASSTAQTTGTIQTNTGKPYTHSTTLQ